MHSLSVCCIRQTVLACLVVWLTGCGGSLKNPVAPPPPTASQGNWQAVHEASRLQGFPYRYGGKSPEQGFDCSGLVHYVYARQGIRLPRTALSMAQDLPAVPPAQRQPGDLLFFNIEDKPFSHVGLYVGRGVFVHAHRTGREVMRSSLAVPYWLERLTGVRRPPKSKSGS